MSRPGRDWFTRQRRLSNVRLAVGPMSVEETAEQLLLLPGSRSRPSPCGNPRRSEGLPLFTEQLAVHTTSEDDLPSVLIDLLDGRLEGLDSESWALLRTLGVAERRLPLSLVVSAAGVRRAELTKHVRDLQRVA